MSKNLIATRSCFGHTSIDYTYQINVLFNQHKVDLIELFLSYINSHKAFFHQGDELLSTDADSEFHSMTTEVRVRGGARRTICAACLVYEDEAGK